MTWERQAWRKIHSQLFCSPSHKDLKLADFGMLSMMIVLAHWDRESDEGRMLNGDGTPMSEDDLADLVNRYTKSKVKGPEFWQRFGGLLSTGTVRKVEDLVILPKFKKWQMDPNRTTHTAESRILRNTGREAEEKQTSLGVNELGGDAESKAKGGRKKSPRSKMPAGLAEHVLSEMRKACVELKGKGAGPRSLTPGMLDALEKLYAAELPTAETWTHVIRRKLADVKRDPKFARFLSIDHLCRPENFRRCRDSPEDTQPGSWRESDFVSHEELMRRLNEE
jgi:hypothetical protein